MIAAINGITEAFDEAFRGDWMSFDDKPTDRERLEMENTEYDWGHNIKNYMEE